MHLDNEKFHHPYDTILSGGLRFGVEIIAWVAGPWYISRVSSWLVIPAIIVLVGLPAVFSTINDKRHVVVPTRGSMRVFIELLLYFVAAVAPWYVWSTIFSFFTTAVVAVALLVGTPRLMWLLKGAPNA